MNNIEFIIHKQIMLHTHMMKPYGTTSILIKYQRMNRKNNDSCTQLFDCDSELIDIFFSHKEIFISREYLL